MWRSTVNCKATTPPQLPTYFRRLAGLRAIQNFIARSDFGSSRFNNAQRHQLDPVTSWSEQEFKDEEDEENKKRDLATKKGKKKGFVKQDGDTVLQVALAQVEGY